MSSEISRAIEAALVKYDNNMKDVPLTDHQHHNHSNYSVQHSQHAVCHCQESGKLQITIKNALVMSEFTISSCSEGKQRGMFISSLLMMYMLSFLDVSLRRDISRPC